jgi:hypothetical protein
MTAPIPTREDERARRHIEGWWFVACELVTVAALLASLVSIVQSSDRPAGRDLLPAGTGPMPAVR